MKRSTPLRARSPLARRTPLRARSPMRRMARPEMTPARRNAKGQPCTLRLPGCYPGPNNERVQLCHLRMFGGGGTGCKPDDTEAVFACTHCHDLLDQRAKWPSWLTATVMFEYIAWALIRTLRLQRAAGIILLKGEQ